jgi:uncharacterized membrane protein (GlpM family)
VGIVWKIIVGGDYVKLCLVASRNSGFCSLQFCSGMRVPFKGRFGLVIVCRELAWKICGLVLVVSWYI